MHVKCPSPGESVFNTALPLILMEKHFNILTKAPSGFGSSFAKYFENGLTCRDKVVITLCTLQNFDIIVNICLPS